MDNLTAQSTPQPKRTVRGIGPYSGAGETDMRRTRRTVWVGLIAMSWLAWAPSAAVSALPGQIVVDPATASWLAYDQGGSFFMCAPGNPEGFLYRGEQQPDGTRNGDQEALINILAPTGANGIYLMAVRSHGGDGDPTQNPFLNNDPDDGLNDAVLDQWEGWFDAMDAQGIVIFFIFYDDGARIWGSPGAEEQAFISALVDRFEHHLHLIWVVAEEYEEAWTTAEASMLAGFIRTADDHDHPIAVHQNQGLNFDFPDDPAVDQFAIQYDETEPDDVHSGMVSAWNDAQGQYNLNLAEAHFWGTGSLSRHNSWATAMGGAYVMYLDWDIENTPVERLEECGYLRAFMELADLSSMAPNDSLGFGDTNYLLAEPGSQYIAYDRDGGDLGIQGLPTGNALLRWLDAVSGNVVESTEFLAGGDMLFARPPGIGNEAALYVSFNLIFADDFESGDTSAWSGTVP